MLGVGLRKLCPQDSFGYAFREKKAVRKSTFGGSKMDPRGGQNRLLSPFGRLLGAKSAPGGFPGRSGTGSGVL